MTTSHPSGWMLPPGIRGGEGSPEAGGVETIVEASGDGGVIEGKDRKLGREGRGEGTDTTHRSLTGRKHGGGEEEQNHGLHTERLFQLFFTHVDEVAVAEAWVKEEEVEEKVQEEERGLKGQEDEGQGGKVWGEEDLADKAEEE